MIDYNPKEWFTFIFRMHKADTFRKLFPMIIAIALYAFIVAFAEKKWIPESSQLHLKNLTILHTLLGFVISTLLVFRTNTAYDRWWEGRKLWGSLVNNSRNLAIKLHALLPITDTRNRVFFKNIIPEYADALKNHLLAESTRVALTDEAETIIIETNQHIPNQLANVMIKKIASMQKEKMLDGQQLLFINNELIAFTDVCGACERIKNTPIPYSYSAFIKKFIFIYIMTMPLGFVFNMGYYVVLVTAFIFYVLASLELIAEEVEDPFSGDENDIPMERIANNIRKHVAEILHV